VKRLIVDERTHDLTENTSKMAQQVSGQKQQGNCSMKCGPECWKERTLTMKPELQMQYSNFKDTLQNIASQIGNVEQEVEEHKYVIELSTFCTFNSLAVFYLYGTRNLASTTAARQLDHQCNILSILQHDCRISPIPQWTWNFCCSSTLAQKSSVSSSGKPSFQFNTQTCRKKERFQSLTNSPTS
jgi:hypothetical protein